MDTVERSENGRNANGTFGAGNQFASRQQRRQHVSKLRDSVLQRLTPESVVELVDALLIKAKGGDLPAIRCALGLMTSFETFPMPGRGSGCCSPLDPFRAFSGSSLGSVKSSAATGIGPISRRWKAGSVRRCSGTSNRHQRSCS